MSSNNIPDYEGFGVQMLEKDVFEFKLNNTSTTTQAAQVPGVGNSFDMPDVTGLNKNVSPELIENISRTENSGLPTKLINKNLRYNINDIGPYRIIMEPTKEKYINKIALARFLRSNNLIDEMIDIKKTGQKKATVYFNTVESANNVLEFHKNIKSDSLEHKFIAYLPLYFIVVKGVITGIPLDMSIEEVKEELADNGDILDIYRMNRFRDGKKEPSDRMCISFRSQFLPKSIKLCYIRSRILPYISKVVYCQKCLRFNHKKENCKGKNICQNCSKRNCKSIEDESICLNSAFCIHCKKSHAVFSDPECKEIVKQNKIRSIMSERALTYTEVRDEFEYFSNNRFNIIDPDSEPIKIHENYVRRNNLNVNQKKHTTIVKVNNKHTQYEEIAPEICKKRKHDEDVICNNGVGLNNEYKVTELEKTINQLKLSLKEFSDKSRINLGEVYCQIENSVSVDIILKNIKNMLEEQMESQEL